MILYLFKKENKYLLITLFSNIITIISILYSLSWMVNLGEIIAKSISGSSEITTKLEIILFPENIILYLLLIFQILNIFLKRKILIYLQFIAVLFFDIYIKKR